MSTSYVGWASVCLLVRIGNGCESKESLITYLCLTCILAFTWVRMKLVPNNQISNQTHFTTKTWIHECG